MRPVTGSLGSMSMDSTILAVRSSFATSLKLVIIGSSRRSLPTRCAESYRRISNSEPQLRVIARLVHDESSLDQRYPHRLTVHTHPTADCSHRDARSGEAHGLCFLADA
jgi:hypothetical protein